MYILIWSGKLVKLLLSNAEDSGSIPGPDAKNKKYIGGAFFSSCEKQITIPVYNVFASSIGLCTELCTSSFFRDARLKFKSKII